MLSALFWSRLPFQVPYHKSPSAQIFAGIRAFWFIPQLISRAHHFLTYPLLCDSARISPTPAFPLAFSISAQCLEAALTCCPHNKPGQAVLPRAWLITLSQSVCKCWQPLATSGPPTLFYFKRASQRSGLLCEQEVFKEANRNCCRRYTMYILTGPAGDTLIPAFNLNVWIFPLTGFIYDISW